MKNIQRVRTHLIKLLRDARGANFVEYIIMVGLVALLALGGFATFGKSVSATIQAQANSVASIAPT